MGNMKDAILSSPCNNITHIYIKGYRSWWRRICPWLIILKWVYSNYSKLTLQSLPLLGKSLLAYSGRKIIHIKNCCCITYYSCCLHCGKMTNTIHWTQTFMPILQLDTSSTRGIFGGITSSSMRSTKPVRLDMARPRSRSHKTVRKNPSSPDVGTDCSMCGPIS